MKTKMLAIAVLFAAVLALSFGQGVYAKGITTVAALSGSAAYPNAKGKAVSKVSAEEKEFQVEIENVKALAGKRLTVYVGGAPAGSMLVNAFGTARLNRNTNNGQTVPSVSSGTTVQVKTAAGKLVASGKF